MLERKDREVIRKIKLVSGRLVFLEMTVTYLSVLVKMKMCVYAYMYIYIV